MAIQSVAGASVSIGAAAGAETLVGFQAVSYTTIGEITNIGDFGRVYNLITHNAVNTRLTKKLKGSYNQGTLSVEMALDEADAGQAALLAASLSDNNYSIRVTAQNGDNYYFHVQVMSYMRSFGGVDDIASASAELEITSDIFTDI